MTEPIGRPAAPALHDGVASRDGTAPDGAPGRDTAPSPDGGAPGGPIPLPEDLSTPFKRRIAVALSLLALSGIAFSWGASWASGQESRLVRDAQRDTMAAESQRLDALANLAEQRSSYGEARTLHRRHDLRALESELLGVRFDPRARQAWDDSRRHLTSLSVLLGPGTFEEQSRSLEAQSLAPIIPLQQRSQAELGAANDWGRRADVLQGSVAMLSIAGTLLGLSLTLTSRMRPYLIWPAAVIAAVVVTGGAALVATPVHVTPDGAVESFSEGELRVVRHQYAEAISAYTRAVETDPGYAIAYERRAIAEAVQASPQRDSMTMYFSASTPTALRASIRDMEKARSLGTESLSSLVHLGYAYASLGRFAEAEPPLRRAVTLYPDLPLPRLDLGLALLGQGRQQDAEKAVDEGIRRLVARPNAVEQRELFATMRSAFFEFASRYPDRGEAAGKLLSKLIHAETQQREPQAISTTRGSITHFTMTQQAYALQIKLRYEDLPRSAPVAWVIYYRATPEDDWVQRPDMIAYQVSQDSSGEATMPVNDTACPTAGEYHAEFYIDGRRAAEAHLRRSRPPAALGSDITLTRRTDLIGGLSYCAPSSWAVSAPYSGAVDLSSPDTRSRISLRALPLTEPPTTSTARAALAKDVADRLGSRLSAGDVKQQVPISDDQQAALIRVLQLPGGLVGGVIVRVGTDNVLRTVTVVVPAEDPSVLTEIAETIAFGDTI